MTTSGSIRGSIVRLREVGSHIILTLDLLITLIVVVLKIKGYAMDYILTHACKSTYFFC